MFTDFNKWLNNMFIANSNLFGNLVIIMFLGTIFSPFLGLYACAIQFAFFAVRWGHFSNKNKNET